MSDNIDKDLENITKKIKSIQFDPDQPIHEVPTLSYFENVLPPPTKKRVIQKKNKLVVVPNVVDSPMLEPVINNDV